MGHDFSQKLKLKTTMIISRKLLVTLFLLTGITSLILLNRKIESPVLQTTEASQAKRTETHPVVASTFKSAFVFPAKNDNTAPITRDILKTEMPADPVQPGKTLELVNSQQKEERVAAIQQLGAYPNQASETLLTQLLITDQEPDVRNAAALSLGIIDTPEDSTLHALIDALEDESEAVRFTALSTLENYIVQEEHSEKANSIKFALENKALSSSVSNVIKEAIKEILYL